VPLKRSTLPARPTGAGDLYGLDDPTTPRDDRRLARARGGAAGALGQPRPLLARVTSVPRAPEGRADHEEADDAIDDGWDLVEIVASDPGGVEVRPTQAWPRARVAKLSSREIVAAPLLGVTPPYGSPSFAAMKEAAGPPPLPPSPRATRRVTPPAVARPAAGRPVGRGAEGIETPRSIRSVASLAETPREMRAAASLVETPRAMRVAALVEPATRPHDDAPSASPEAGPAVAATAPTPPPSPAAPAAPAVAPVQVAPPAPAAAPPAPAADRPPIRRERSISIGWVVLLACLAGVGYWKLESSGSPVVASAKVAHAALAPSASPGIAHARPTSPAGSTPSSAPSVAAVAATGSASAGAVEMVEMVSGDFASPLIGPVLRPSNATGAPPRVDDPSPTDHFIPGAPRTASAPLPRVVAEDSRLGGVSITPPFALPRAPSGTPSAEASGSPAAGPSTAPPSRSLQPAPRSVAPRRPLFARSAEIRRVEAEPTALDAANGKLEELLRRGTADR